MADNALRPRWMLGSHVGLQARLTFKWFLANIADNMPLPGRVGRDALVTHRLRARRTNDSRTGASLRNEGIRSEVRLASVRLSLLVRLLEVVIPLDEGGG